MAAPIQMVPAMIPDKLLLACVCVTLATLPASMQDHPENWEAVLRSIGVRSLDFASVV